MASRGPTSSEVLGLVEAQQATIDDLSRRLTRAEEKVQIQETKNTRQEDSNRTVLIGVLIASFLIVATVAAEVMLSTKHDDEVYSNIYDKVMTDQMQYTTLQARIDSLDKDYRSELQLLRARNPYLK